MDAIHRTGEVWSGSVLFAIRLGHLPFVGLFEYESSSRQIRLRASD